MYSLIDTDTICAVSTPAGVGGIAVIRVSGPEAVDIVDKIWRGKPMKGMTTHTAHLGTVFDPESGMVLDQGVATLFLAPGSFTGEDVVELSLHGSRYVQREAINLLTRYGCRLAEPGEFTRRAFVAGKMDLAEAEAVADVIASTSRAAHRVAVSQMRGGLSKQLESLRSELLDLASLLELELDFSEEDVEFASRSKLLEIAETAADLTGKLMASFATGQALKEGIPVVIIGKTNAGKSTLLNLLTGHDRAIVSDIHGTTRDTIDDTIEINGIPFRIIDTAGLRITNDPIESLGIQRTLQVASRARIILHLIDSTDSEDTSLTEIAPGFVPESDSKIIHVFNKIDLTGGYNRLDSDISVEEIAISALTGEGVDRLRDLIVKLSGVADAIEGDQVMLTNHRHYEALKQANESLRAVISGLQSGISGDFIAQDLRQALLHIGSVTGAITTPEILSTIFSRFCIGK